MVNNEILMPVWHTLSTMLNGIGVLAWLWAVLSALVPRLNYSFRVSPTATSLRIFRLLAHRGVVCLLLIGAAHLPLSLLMLGNPDDLSPLAIALVAMLIGTGLHLLLGPKGLGMPLGNGLSMTIDRAPHLGFLLSKYVLSFHVDKNFIKERHRVTDLIAQAMNSAKAAGDEYDFVLKSWIFADRDDSSNERVKQVRMRMRSIHRTVMAFIATVPIIGVLWFTAYVGGSTQLLTVGLWLLIAGLGLAMLMLALMLCYARKLMQAICSDPNRSVPTDAARLLAQQLGRKTRGFHHEFIAHRPIPMFHLFSMSVTTRDIIKTCGGAEAGIVLMRR